MPILLTKHFGEIDLDNPKEYYETEVELHERKTEITISIINPKMVDEESIKAIDDYIDNLIINEKVSRIIIQENFQDQREAKNYIDFEIEKLDESDISILTTDAKKNLKIEEQLLSALYLLRVSFYPEKDDKVFAVYDYTIEEDLTNNLLVVIINKDNSTRITIES